MRVSVDIGMSERQCPLCGIWYAVDDKVMEHHDKSGSNWFCPNGHSLIYTLSQADKQRKRAEAAEREAANLRDNLTMETLSHRATKGLLTKERKRIAHGVCPCCHRTFANVERHMTTKHPGFPLDGSEGEPE